MKKSISKVLSVIIFAFLILGFMFIPLYATTTLPYGMSATSVSVGAGSTLASSTTQVGFGGRRWYVVGFNGTGVNKGAGYITLLSKLATGTSIFSDAADSTWNDYSGSELQTAVNSLLSSVDSREQNAMVALTLDGVNGTQPTNQKVWAPSYTDVSAISQDVRKLDNPWWIRSTCGTGNPIYISVDGTINSEWGLSSTMSESVRPGTAVNLSNVLYAAPISGAKDSAVGIMNSVNFSSEIKFTILDNANLGLSITSAPASLTKNPGDTINLDFTGASIGTGKYVSCVLVSQTDNMIKYYAKLSTAANGTLSIPISAGVQPGSYTLLIYNELICSGDNSDYASSPISVSLTVTGSANTAPALRSGVPSTAAASVSVNSAYTIDLSTIFYDPDGNTLSYRVYVNGSSSAISAAKNYSFTPTVAGTTTLRFTAYDGAAESVSYTVTLTATNVNVTSITVTAENGATSIGRNSQLQLYYTAQPSNATNKAVTWTVTFAGAGSLADGDVDAGNMLRTSNVTSNGSIKIRATAQDGSGIYGEITLSILSNIVSGISVSAASEDLTINDTTQMTAAVSPSNANQSVTWSISQGSGIASISTSGLLSLTGSGTVTVRATAKDGSGIYGEKTLTVKNVQHAPSAPTLASKTADSVTLNSAAGQEYSNDGFTWQSSTTFSNLTPNTSYNFYARMAQTASLQVSPASAALSVKTEKAVLGGFVSITGVLQYGATITANTSGLTANPFCSLGTLSYRWTREGADITGATGNSYVLGADDCGKVINVTVTSDNCNGSISSTNTASTGKANPDYTIPTGLSAIYGDTLADVGLSAGFTWNAPLTTSVGEPGLNSFTLTYTPSDTACYNIITDISATVTVGKDAPQIIAAPSASAITYGKSLSGSALLDGSYNVTGSFAWTDGTIKPAVSDSNKTGYSVTFTPTDTIHYNTSTVMVKLIVNKATPVITTPPAASAITYGQTLAASVLSGWSANVSGNFGWDDGSVKPSVSDSGTTEYSVTFTPDDTGNYSTVAAKVKLIVNKATPVITTPPAASAITYGQTLAASVLSGWVANVGGNFGWDDGSVQPSVSDSGTTAYSVTFTPDDTGNYNTVAATVKLTVNKAATSVTSAPSASAITYGQTLSSSVLSGGTGSVTGSFAWTDGTIKPAVSDSGTTEYSVTFTPDSGNYAISTAKVKLTVNKATPVITTPPAASAITYGQTLSASVLSGWVANVGGSFGWDDGSVQPSVSDSGTTAYDVTFTPDDTGNYNTVAATVKLTVNKATPSVTAAPSAPAITYGQALSDSVLSGGTASVGGGFAWTDKAIKPAVSDSNSTAYSVTFTPDDSDNYNTASVTVKLTVNKAATSVAAAPSAPAITYGHALSDSVLSGGTGSVAGSFAWTDGTIKPAVSDSNNTEYSVTFTPDSGNYAISTAKVKLTVNKATPVITTPPSAAAITYGQTLSDSELSGWVADVAGSFDWDDGSVQPSVSDSGTTAYDVTFTPDDTGNYNTVAATVKLTVNKATPSVTAAPSAPAITYGQALSDSVLSGGTASVGGSFAWTDGTIKPAVSDSNTTAYSVTFTPDDSDNYNTASATVKLTVNKAATSVTTPPSAQAITYGQTLSSSMLLDGTGSVAGSFAWTDGTIKPAVSDSGTTEYSVTFTPDSGNYAISTAKVKLTVNKATPVITTPPSAAAITYGQTLAASVLSGWVASVGGSFGWDDGSVQPSVSDSGTTAYDITFTPDDSDNYNTVAATVKLTVNKATPSVTAAPSAPAITYGQALSDSVLSGGTGSVAGSFAWTDGTIRPAVSDSNNTEYSVTFTPDSGNYAISTAKVKLTVNKATPVITTPPSAAAITYGQTLAASVLSGWVANVGGSFGWDDGAVKPSVSDSGTTAYDVTFTPDDTGNYNTVAATVKLTVNKATPVITTPPSAPAITYGQALSDSVLSGGTASVGGGFAWTDGTIKPAVSDSNSTAYSVTFTPDDSDNYNTASATVKLTVNKAATSVTTPPSAQAITYGQTLSSSMLLDGTGSVAGSFAWTDGTIKPAVSDSGTTEYSVTFTPDSGNYAISTAKVKLTVNKATPVITTPPSAAAITYGQTLSDSELSGWVADVAGSFDWDDGSVQPSVSDSGTTAYDVTFTPDDTGNYNTVAATVKLTVNKATPSVTAAPSAPAITYGQALSDSVLSGGTASVGGSFAWTDGTIKPAVSDSNTTAYSVTFTPDDSDNYNTASATVKLTVNKAATSVTTPPSAQAITYGQTLSSSMLLDGTGSVAGSFAWTDGTVKPAVSDSNNTEYSVTFTPDSGNYAISTAKVKLTVNKATPVITTPPSAAAITYGQTLSDSELSGWVADVAGSFGWDDGSVQPSVSDSGTTAYDVTFTPDDSDNYDTVAAAVKLTVNKATPSVTAAPSAPAITYGQALSDSVLSGGTASVGGGFEWTDGTIEPSVSDSETTAYSVTFTPDDNGNYNTASATVKLTVNKAATSVTDAPSAQAITYGQTLSSSMLSGGTGSVAGSFAWTDATMKPAVSDSNNTEYSVTFTPDSGNYAISTAKVKLTVNKATPVITTPPAASAITYGQTLSDSELSGWVADVAGRFDWDDGSVQPSVSDSGTTAYDVTFTPDDSDNYNTVAATVKLTVNKATPSVTAVPSAPAITYGQALSDSVLSGGTASVGGGFEWTDGTIKPAVSDSNSTAYSVTFTPDDSDNYNTASVTVKLTVNKATPIITVPPVASAITYGQTLSDSVLSGGLVNVEGSFAWTDGTIKPAVSDSNNTEYSVTFTPRDISNYNTATTKIQIKVNKKTPVIIPPVFFINNVAQIVIDGKPQLLGTYETTTDIYGRTTTTVTVDTGKLTDILKAEEKGITITIPIAGSPDAAVGILTGSMIKVLQEKEATIILQTERASYIIPATEINVDELSKQFGKNISLADISIKIETAVPLDETVKIVENAAEKGDFSIIIPPMDFNVSCSYNGINIDIDNFSGYVERLIKIPDGVNPDNISTAIIVKPDGSVIHVPTQVVVINGVNYVKIMSLTNSTYTVISHKVEFSDLKNHSARDIINDMGSRMIVSGSETISSLPTKI